MNVVMTPGRIYFLRERDYLTGDKSRYVKIGIVRNEKETEDRIKEHNTGNPREIIDHVSFETPMVERLETLLHYRFGTKWISGEWFDFTDKELNDAITEAKKLIPELKKADSILKQADELKKMESGKPEKEATKADEIIWTSLVETKLRANLVNTQHEISENPILHYLGDAEGIDGVAHALIPKSNPKFDQKGFEKVYPKIFAEFNEELKGGINQRFNLKNSLKLKDKYPDVKEQHAALKAFNTPAKVIAKILPRTQEIEKFHAEIIRHNIGIKNLEWELIKLEAELKVNVGECSGIKNLCSWNRTKQTKYKLDTKKLKESYPKEFNEFLREGKPSYKINIFPYRPYPITFRDIKNL